MFIEIGKSGALNLFNPSKYICLGIIEGVNEITIEVNDRSARIFTEEKKHHVYFDKSEGNIIVVTAQKHKEITESDFKDPNLVYVGS